MTTATETKTTAAPPEPAPQREWQVGDRVRILEAVRSVGELSTITDTEPPAGCFVVPDSGMFAMYVSHSGLELVEAAPPAPAAAVAPAIAPPAFDSEPFESVEHYLGSAILWQENEEFITPDDGTPIGYRGWQIITDSHAGTLASFSVQTPEGDWYSGLCLNDGPLSWLDHQQAIAYAKATIDNAIALAEKLSGQMSLLEQPAVEAEIVATEPTARLAELEADIDAGLSLINDGIKSIWAAATSIRQERLWEHTGHASYVAYCQERWGWGKATAHEHAVAGGVLQSLLLSGVPVEEIPDSTRALMELNKVEPEQRPAVLAEAAASNGGRATAKAVREVAQPKPPADHDRMAEDEYAELRAAGIPVYRIDTSDAAIAEGLDSGYLRPTTEQPTSAAAAPQEASSPGEGDPDYPQELLEPSDGLLAVGSWCRVEGVTGMHVFVQPPTHPDGFALLWSARGGRLLAKLADLHPSDAPPDPDALLAVGRVWLREMAAVLGGDVVQAIAAEVVK